MPRPGLAKPSQAKPLSAHYDPARKSYDVERASSPSLPSPPRPRCCAPDRHPSSPSKRTLLAGGCTPKRQNTGVVQERLSTSGLPPAAALRSKNTATRPYQYLLHFMNGQCNYTNFRWTARTAACGPGAGMADGRADGKQQSRRTAGPAGRHRPPPCACCTGHALSRPPPLKGGEGQPASQPATHKRPTRRQPGTRAQAPIMHTRRRPPMGSTTPVRRSVRSESREGRRGRQRERLGVVGAGQGRAGRVRQRTAREDCGPLYVQRGHRRVRHPRHQRRRLLLCCSLSRREVSPSSRHLHTARKRAEQQHQQQQHQRRRHLFSSSHSHRCSPREPGRPCKKERQSLVSPRLCRLWPPPS